MMGHAYARRYGWEYGGICGESPHRATQTELIRFLGLGEILKSGCPNNNTREHHLLPQMNYEVYNGTHILTKDWIEYIRSVMPSELLSRNQTSDNKLEVAVHVRRGDVTLCHWWRFLPNRHYIEILDMYVPKDAHVTIYTEANARNKLGELEARNYSLDIDGALPDVWRAMMQSDVLIMSKSDFSVIPALLGRGRVLYTPFKARDPMEGWEIIDPKISNVTETLAKTYCQPGRKRRRLMLLPKKDGEEQHRQKKSS
mmetsp:Transcript_38066/g.56647  ORF Transcript_38066/g.56647 Transcript_38066/m.56647 type:complete len:256 (-) Transcript_38066:271-1038(-)